MPRRRLLIAAVLTVATTGCGSAGSPPGGNRSPGLDAAPSGRGLQVTVTDGRVGDATRADETGSTQLPVHRAPLRSRPNRDGVAAGADCAGADALPAADNLAAIATTTLCMLNAERAAAGLAPLNLNDQLAAAAIEHSQDMVAHTYFDHQSLDGRDVVARIGATGYIPDDRRWTVGENLAWGTGTLSTPQGIVAAWMASQGHRDNVLRPEFREIGLGIVLGNPRGVEGGGATYTTNFGAVSSRAVPTRQVAARRVAAKRRTRRAAHRRSRATRARLARARRSRGPVARISLGPTRKHARAKTR